MTMQLRWMGIEGHWTRITLFCLLTISLARIATGKKVFQETLFGNPKEGETTKAHTVRDGWQELSLLQPWIDNAQSALKQDESKLGKGVGRGFGKSSEFHVSWITEALQKKHSNFKNNQMLHNKRTAWMYRNPARLKTRITDRHGESDKKSSRQKHSTKVLRHHPSGKLYVNSDNPNYSLIKNKNGYVKRRLLAVVSSSSSSTSSSPGKSVITRHKPKADSPTSTRGPELEAKTENSSADNRTTNTQSQFVGKKRWRAKHSEDAMWGLACTIFLLVLLLWAVWFSGMCKSSKEQFVHVEYCTAIQQMSVREMLKNRARHLPIFRSRRERQQPDQVPLIEVTSSSPGSDEDDPLFDQRWESIDGQSERPDRDTDFSPYMY